MSAHRKPADIKATIADGRAALLDTAWAQSSPPRADVPTRRARSIWAASAIADGAHGDDALINAAVELTDVETVRLADGRALDTGQMALKLAVLTADLLRDFDSSPQAVQRLALCASTLADAVTQSAGPIALPAGALAGLREGDLVTAAKWRVRREAALDRAFGEAGAEGA